MPICDDCGKQVSGFWASQGRCPACARVFEAEAEKRNQVLVEQLASAAQRIMLTTETSHNLPVKDRLGIVSAEVVIGMNLFKDIASAFSDTFGGRSKTMQAGLRQAREAALAELKLEASSLGADAVVGVDLDYSEISGGGKSMLFLVASGTAVSLQEETAHASPT